jgi:hypothetical protein
MKNAIAYITRAAKVEEKVGGLRGSFEYYASIEKLAKAEKAKALKAAIDSGLAAKIVTGSSDRVPAKDILIAAIGYPLWDNIKNTGNTTTVLWHPVS